MEPVTTTVEESYMDPQPRGGGGHREMQNRAGTNGQNPDVIVRAA
jgi:hypothetical protein